MTTLLKETFKNDKAGFISIIFMGIILIAILFMSTWTNTPLETLNDAKSNFEDETKPYLGASYVPSRDKIEKVMTNRWFTEKEADYITDVCSTKKNPRNCAMLSYAICISETGCWETGVWRDHMNNLYWLTYNGDGTERAYANRMASFEFWVEKYNKHWYNNDCYKMVYKSNYVGSDPERRKNWLKNCEMTMLQFYK